MPADKTSYGNESVQTLVTQYASDLPAVSLDGTDFVQEGIISTEVSTEWKTYLPLLSKQDGDLKSQLKEQTTNETMIALLPNLHKLAAICLILPVSTASVERSFSHMKQVKTRLRNRMGEQSSSNLMKVAIESPETLLDKDLDENVCVWNRKYRRIVV